MEQELKAAYATIADLGLEIASLKYQIKLLEQMNAPEETEAVEKVNFDEEAEI